jgi:hypothetical protein
MNTLPRQPSAGAGLLVEMSMSGCLRLPRRSEVSDMGAGPAAHYFAAVL